MAPYVSYSNIILKKTDSTEQAEINVNKYTFKNRVGFNFGWTYTSLLHLGLSWGLEGRYIPNTTPEIIAKVGIALNFQKRH